MVSQQKQQLLLLRQHSSIAILILDFKPYLPFYSDMIMSATHSDKAIRLIDWETDKEKEIIIIIINFARCIFNDVC